MHDWRAFSRRGWWDDQVDDDDDYDDDDAEVEFVHAVSAGGSVKFLPAE